MSDLTAEQEQQQEEEVFSSSDPAFWDYVRLKDFTKKTGIEERDCHAFCAKELFDNAADIIEKWRLNNATITIDIKNDPDDGNCTSSDTMIISVSNPNPGNKPVFGNLEQTFNYKRSFSSKSNQYKVTRGAQGDALKELGTIPYMLTNSGDGGEDKPWEYSLVFQHNKKVDNVYIEVDRKNRIIKRRLERSACEDTDTKVTITLPTLSPKTYMSFLDFCRIYTLFNTHLSFRLFVDGKQHNTLPALLPMSENYNNPNSIYCYSEVEFQDFLTDLYDKNMSVYDALIRSEFREINQPGRFEDLKDITIAQLTTHKTNEIHSRLRKSMLPMSELSTPYYHSKTKRKAALVNRYRLMAPSSLQLDYDRAVYQRTDPKDTIYSNKTIRFPYSFEVLAIPIKKQAQEESIIISGVNYSTSINNHSYFRAGNYSSGYNWTHQNGESLSAMDIEEIIRVSSAGADINYDDNIASRKQRQPCVIIAHLVSPRPEYKHGYGKSTLKLEPYSTRMAETIEAVVKRIPLRNRTAPSKEYEGLTGNLDLLLQRRWQKVKENPLILDPISPYYDPWTQSTVWYHLREEYLLPIERQYHVTMIKKDTRTYITAMISERCEKLEGSPKREQLGIFASPRATMYVNGQWYRVDIDDIPALAGKGTDVIFIEKQGIVEIIKHLADIYGLAFVNTQGHFAEYPRNLVPEITEQGGNVVILTDFDCAGIHIAERIIADDVTYNYVDDKGNTSLEQKDGYHYKEHIGRKVKRLGIDMETLEYFMSKVQEEGQTITVEVRDDETGNLNEETITTLEQLIEHVQEPYPKAENKEDKQQPGVNVITSLIRYAKKYLLAKGHCDIPNSKYQDYRLNYGKHDRYEYVFENFEYLTGLDVEEAMKYMRLWNHDSELNNDEKGAINDLLADRPPEDAKRIELDSVLKVVKANMFSEFIVHKLQEFFPERKYIDRAITLPNEYFGEKFNILPENTRELFLRAARIADKAAKPTEDEIRKELENWSPTDEEATKKGIPTLLVIPTENMVNEMLLAKAVEKDPDMQTFEEEAKDMLDALPPAEDEDTDDTADDEDPDEEEESR